MDSLKVQNAIKYLTKGALSGASKTSLLREFKEGYEYSDKETELNEKLDDDLHELKEKYNIKKAEESFHKINDSTFIFIRLNVYSTKHSFKCS